MKVIYNTHALNANKHPLLPSEYPWTEYHVEDDFICPEGFLELPEADFEAMKSAIDTTAFKAAIKKENIQSVTPRQIRLALLQLGVTGSMIDTALNSLPEPQKSQALIEWNYASVYERTWPLVDQVGAILGWSDTQLDDLWILASGL